ncbi:pre-peptidase C-terminal domain-containing protein [Cyanobacteria bacterium FACHB-471]|nr:pre-peptidase C-terminal domain-containing protein [Cyanobacteria bacterium FACHB-471]
MTISNDVLGDTFGSEPTQLDIESVNGRVSNDNLLLTVNFANSIAAPSTGLAEAVVGFIDLDLDQDPLTGISSNQSFFAPLGQQGGSLGAEISIDLFSEQLTTGFVDLINTADFTILGQAPIVYQTNSLEIQVPLELLGDDGALNYSTVVGTVVEPTDAAPNTEVGVVDLTNGGGIGEPNDTIFEAIATELSSENLGTFSFAGFIGDSLSADPNLDVDFFQFQLDAGDQVSIDIDAREFGSSVDTLLRVFDSAGNEISINDDTAAPGELLSLDSFLEFTATFSDTYYVGVSSFPNNLYDPFVAGTGSVSGTTGDYNIEISLAAPIEFIGTPDDDLIVGTNGFDLISGLEGNDNLLGLAGSDQIFGGDGDDVIIAGDGNDTIEGENGADEIYGDLGNDTIAGGNGFDVILGGDGNDVISGGRGKDRIFGDFGDDVLSGEQGDDIINAGEGSDSVFGDAGGDRLFGDFGFDFLEGGAGNDFVDGGGDDDSAFGGIGDDQLFGSFGFDLLDGGDGADVLIGGVDSDSLNGGDGNDTLIGVDPFNPGFGLGFFEIDFLTGGLGSDTFVLGDSGSIYYNDGDPASGGDNDYALITDFDLNQDVIQLSGSADFYSLDFFTSSLGTIDAAIIYDPGVEARGELVSVIQNVSSNLSISEPSFVFV